MRKFLFVAPVLMSACSTVPAQPPVRGETPGRICQAEGTRQFIGQVATQESGAAIMRATNAAVLRWAPYGAMLTMDFRTDRVTVRIGADGKITDVNCG